VFVLFLQGHEEYLNRMRLTDSCPWNRIKGLKDVELCKIQGLSYSTYGGSGESCCKLTLKFIDDTSRGYRKEFKITLLEPVDFPDFLVERTRFEAAIAQNWVIRDKCRVWWDDDGEEGGSWWEGRVSAIRPKSTDFPESPWERYVIQYKNDGSDHLHSPWELHDADNPLVSWKHPHINSSIRNKLLSAVTTLQEKSRKNQVKSIYFQILCYLAALLLLFFLPTLHFYGCSGSVWRSEVGYCCTKIRFHKQVTIV
jgi:PH-interacting protein